MSYEPNDSDQRGQGRQAPPSRGMPTILIWLLIIGLVVAVLYYSAGSGDKSQVETSPATFLEWVNKNPQAFKDAYITDGTVYAELKSEAAEKGKPARFEIRLPGAEAMDRYDELLTTKLGKTYGGNREASTLAKMKEFLLPVIPWIIIFGVIYFVFFRHLRQAGMGGGVLNFGRTRARLVRRESSKITFDDVAGMVEAKEDVLEIIEFLRNPKKFQRLGGRIPRGVLFIGPPGTGKTLLAKAIAGEANVPFFSISGSDFVEMFVGVGASRVRDLFRQAKESSPCIIFLDEIDAVGRKRGAGFTGAHDEREQTLNAILVEMDGFDTNDQVITIAATNRPDVLDPALRRPGRFDREVTIGMPDIKEREAILHVHAGKIKLADGIDLAVIARGTPGFSGADLSALVNEAALAATMHDKDAVDLADLEEARDKVRWGRSRRSQIMDEMDKRVSAYHEGGHALMTVLLQPNSEPLHKVTIIPRGHALGATMFLPEKDRYMMRRKECMAHIMVGLGGRVAEELIFDDISTGAAQDIRGATELARRMVMEWGMSKSVGPIHYSSHMEREDGFGPDIFGSREHSENTAREIDEEIRRIVNECYTECRRLLTDNKDKLERLARALLAFESLDADEVRRVLDGLELHREPNGITEVHALPSTDIPAPPSPADIPAPPGDGGMTQP